MEINFNYNELLNSGWVKAEYWYGPYSLTKLDDRGRRHQINLDVNRPHLIDTHRIDLPGKGCVVDGYIGDFVGGKGRKRATNYKKYLDLNYINNIKSYLDSKIK